MPLRSIIRHRKLRAGEGRSRRTGRVFRIAKRAAKKVLKDQSETKMLVVDIADASITAAAPSFQVLSNIPQGDTNLTRDGNSVKPTGIYVKGYLDWVQGGASTVNTQIIKVALVQSKQGVIASAAACTRDGTSASGFEVLDTKKVRVLGETTFARANGVALPGVGQADIPSVPGWNFEFKAKLRGKMDFAAAATAEPLRGNLYLLAITDSDATTGYILKGASHLYFKDY